MAEIVVAVLAETPEAFAHDMELATTLSDRIQIDVADGKFAPNRTLNLSQIYWPDEVRADLHLMLENPLEQLSTVVAQNPHLVIFHAEALDLGSSEFSTACTTLKALGIKVGLALLPDTSVAEVSDWLKLVDHVLIFTGDLGHYGGVMREDCLVKADQIKRLYPDIEVGVDGGVSPDNAAIVAAAGIDVLNVGGFVQSADDPRKAYATLKAAL